MGFVLLQLFSLHAYPYTLSTALSGPKIDFGSVSPADPPVTIPHALQIVLVSTGSSWELNVQANSDFVTTPDPTYTFPVGRLAWALHPTTAPTWTSFKTTTPADTVTTGNATPTTGTVVDLDYKLDIHYSDPARSMTYQTTITYTAAVGSLDTSFATPNPFNPNTETTTIHYLLSAETTVSIRILDVSDEAIRNLSPSPANPQPAAPQSVVWDGKNDSAAIVDDGQYKYLIQDDSNNVIASGVIIVDSGTATIQGTVTDAATTDPLAGATVTLFESDGTQVSSTTSATDPPGSYSLASVMEGYYYLHVERDRFYPKTTDVFFVPRGGTVIQNITLSYNRTFLLTKDADTKVVAVGDIVKYEVKVQNIGFGDASEVRIEDQLPPGFIYIPGTSEIANVAPVEPTKSGDLLTWKIGDLSETESVALTYMVAVGFETELGDRSNRAFAFGKVFGKEVSTGPACAYVRVKGGLFRKEGTIIGKVFFDDNGNGVQDEEEEGLPQVEIILDDGTHVITDDFGRYSIPSVRPGRHTLKLIAAPLGYRVQDANPQQIDVPTSGLATANFALRTGAFDHQPMTLVGIAELEVGFSDWKPYLDPSLRFYMEGVTGDFSSIIALDLDRTIGDAVLNASKENLYYPDYGDESGFCKGVLPFGPAFIRIQKGPSFLTYGRYNVRFEETKFTNYTRSLPGVKTHLQMGSIGLTGFLSRTSQVPAREEIPGADSHGPYLLTNAPIVPNSELVRVITRLKEDPTEIIKVENKERDKDYTIDPDTGEITFVEPIPKGDADGNPVYIVVNYEFIPMFTAPVSLIVGGRLGASLADVLQLGLTCIREGQSPEDYQLGGLDAVLNLGNVTLSTELAQSSGDLYDLSNRKISFAGRASLRVNLADETTLTSYYRLVQPDFANLTNPVSQKDIQEFGATFNQRIAESIDLSEAVKLSHDNVLGQPDVVTTTSFSPVDLDLRYKPSVGWQLDLGYTLTLSFDDLTPHKGDNSVGTFSFTGSRSFGKGNLSFKYSLETFNDVTGVNPDTLAQMLSGKVQYALFDNVSLNVLQELNLKVDTITGEASSLAGTTTVGSDLKIYEDTHVLLVHQQDMNFMEHTSSAVTTASLNSKFYLNERTTGTFGLDLKHSSAESVTGTILLGLDSTLSAGIDSSLKAKFTPFAGQVLTSASFSFKGDIPDVVSFTGEVEFTPTKVPFSLILHGNVDKTLSVSIDLVAQLSGEKANGHLSLGAAYRPWGNDRLNLLSKFRIGELGASGTVGQESSFEAIYELFPKLSISGKFANRIAIKEGASVKMEMLIGRANYELTERLNLVGEARVYHQDVDRSLKRGSMLELGYRVCDNAQVAVGFNFLDSVSSFDGIVKRGPFIRVGVVGF